MMITFCRAMADKMLKKADLLYDKEILPRYKKMRECTMDDFGPEFDPDRGKKWSDHMNTLRNEIEFIDKQHQEMLEVAGDWEDREFAARWKKIVDFIASRSDNPLLERLTRNYLMSQTMISMGAPNLAKYIKAE